MVFVINFTQIIYSAHKVALKLYNSTTSSITEHIDSYLRFVL